MKIGLFYELQTPRPWGPESEHATITQALDQIELADRVGLDYIWAVEHHFLEEYCHCSAPEVLLAAASQRTKRIRLGHGIVLTSPAFNHPARVAERIATLDHVSNGRLDFGTGEGTSDIELDGFGITREQKRAAWEEGTRAIVGMLTEPIFGGLDGQFVQFPRRSIVPKPYQKPHPPLWVACNRREKIVDAAHKGMGALNFSFGVKPDLARKYSAAYYEAFAERIDPIGLAPNPNLAVVTGFNCTNSQVEADRAFAAMKFFMHAINYYFEPGRTMPEQLDIRGTFGDGCGVSGVDDNDPTSLGIFGDPGHVERSLRAYEESGIDQVILVAQAGGYDHDQIMSSLELFGREVLPAFKQRDLVASSRKAERLAAAGLA